MGILVSDAKNNGITVSFYPLAGPDYYENLLTPKENTDFDDKFKEYVDNEVSEITKNSIVDIDNIFQHPITETEIKNILTLLPNNKAPGDDGITYKQVRFFGEFWSKSCSTSQQNS